jgi:cobalamin biosynthesis protein CobT
MEAKTAEQVYQLALDLIDNSDDHDSAEEESKAQEQKEAEDKAAAEGEEAMQALKEAVNEAMKELDELMGHNHRKAGKEDGEPYEGEQEPEPDTYEDYVPFDRMSVTRASNLNPHTSRDNHEWAPYEPLPYYEKGTSIAATARRLFQSVTQRRITHNNRSGRLDRRDLYRTSIAATARRLFQSVTQRRITHNNRSGRLDRRDLYRIPDGARDVFTRKEKAIDTKGTAIFVLADISGSMLEDDKFNIMPAAVALLNDACSPLGIPMKIAAFTERGEVTHYIIKEYNEVQTGMETLDYFGRTYKYASMNTDGESILWAFNDLMKRTEERKILIVISDGMPCSHAEGDAGAYTADVVSQCSKYCEIYGIGLLTNSVKEFYSEYTVLKKATDLEQCLLEVVKTKIFK